MTQKYTFALAAVMAAAMAAPAANAQYTPEKVSGWGDFKLYIDPGHEGRSNMGIWSYSEAEKVLAVALNIQDMLTTYTDMPAENLRLCRYTEADTKTLQERTDEANAWGADFYYSIHSDAGNAANQIVLLFGGWKVNGEFIEKQPNGGKRFGEFLEPNLSGVMRVGSRGNRYDRDFYYPGQNTHDNRYPYLHVNRESNMASLLSEGAYHTQAIQQRRNMNAEYKRLEAFAAFQAILQYVGVPLPKQNFLHGMVSNSENGQPINNARITVDGKTYVTDSYESLFYKYSKNPNLIQNGLFTFENLEPGKTYDVLVEADGYASKTVQATIKEGGNTTPDFVTFCDVELLNEMPAVVSSINIDNVESVSPLTPVVLTFSRNMVRETVEQAFSVNNDGEVTLSWENDYTLSIDVSKLDPLWDYTFTIKGDVAKNSQTDQFFDGDGDGQPGGDYTLTIIMAEPDVTAPQIVTTYPAMDGEVVYTHRPPVRVEFDEEINFNDDNETALITVTNAKGEKVAGTVNHAVIAGKSVLHFIAAQDYPLDECFLVKVEGGIQDLYGNATEPTYFRFLTEYRAQTDAKTIIPCTGTDSFWNPAGSGSTQGVDKDNSTVGVINVAPNYQSSSSTLMTYVFDPDSQDGGWFIRHHNPEITKTGYSDFSGIFTAWIYGDGSNNSLSMMVRVPNSGGSLKEKSELLPINFRGWGLFTWDLLNDEYTHFTGTDVIGAKGTWRFDSFTLHHEDTDPEDEEVPFQAWTGQIAYNSLEYTKWDNDAQRAASINDIVLPDGVENITADDSNAPAVYYNLNGIRVSGKLLPGVYVRQQGSTATKVVVK